MAAGCAGLQPAHKAHTRQKLGFSQAERKTRTPRTVRTDRLVEHIPVQDTSLCTQGNVSRSTVNAARRVAAAPRLRPLGLAFSSGQCLPGPFTAPLGLARQLTASGVALSRAVDLIILCTRKETCRPCRLQVREYEVDDEKAAQEEASNNDLQVPQHGFADATLLSMCGQRAAATAKTSIYRLEPAVYLGRRLTVVHRSSQAFLDRETETEVGPISKIRIRVWDICRRRRMRRSAAWKSGPPPPMARYANSKPFLTSRSRTVITRAHYSPWPCSPGGCEPNRQLCTDGCM